MELNNCAKLLVSLYLGILLLPANGAKGQESQSKYEAFYSDCMRGASKGFSASEGSALCTCATKEMLRSADIFYIMQKCYSLVGLNFSQDQLRDYFFNTEAGQDIFAEVLTDCKANIVAQYPKHAHLAYPLCSCMRTEIFINNKSLDAASGMCIARFRLN